MAFLNAARPLINENDQLVIRLRGDKNGGMTVVIEPHVKLTDPETEDAELAVLQAALAMPLVLRVSPDAPDLDKALSEALAGMKEARGATVGALSAYAEAQAEARNQAALAGKAKADKAKADKAGADKGKAPTKDAPAAKPLPAAPATEAVPAEATGTETTGNVPATPAPAVAAAAQSTIFE